MPSCRSIHRNARPLRYGPFLPDTITSVSYTHLVLFLAPSLVCLLTSSFLYSQQSSGERVFFHAKVFTGDPQNPYAEAVAVRGDKILAVGSLPEVEKSTSAKAERLDLEGKSLFPGFIDSHSHSIDGGLALISADASEKVQSLNELPPFVEDAKKTGKAMRGDIVEILGMPLEFWSHIDTLNTCLLYTSRCV